MKIEKGYVIKLKNGREWIVESFDGKYIHTKEGAQFAPTHPDIASIEEKKTKSEDTNFYYSKKKNK